MTTASPSLGHSQPDNEEPSTTLPDEQTSLLPIQHAQSTQGVDSVPSPSRSCGNKPKQYIKTIALYATFNLMADLGGNMTAGPEVRLLELAVCREFYWKYDPSVIGPPPFAFVDESLCKNREIQSKLAQLRSIKSSLLIFPGLFLTIFSGSLGDIYGRKPLILLSYTGVVLSYLWPLFVCWFYNVFSPRWIWASAVFLCLGGGSQVLSALLLSTVVDVTPRYLTTTVIYLVNGAELVTEFISPPIGAALMEKNVWLAFLVSIPIILLAFPFIVALPESLAPALRRNGNEANTAGADRQPEQSPKIPPKSVQLTLKTIGVRLFKLLQNPAIRISLALGFLDAFAAQSSILLLQFASKRLSWSLGHATYLLSIRAAVALLLTLGLLPGTTYLLTKKLKVQPLRADVLILRLSLAALSIGYCLISSSVRSWLLILGNQPIMALVNVFSVVFKTRLATLIFLFANPAILSHLGCVISASGSNALQTLQGIASSLADQSSTAELYSTLAFVELVAIMIGGPIAAAAFNAGMRLGDKEDLSWAGLPFYISAFLTAISIALTFAFRVKKTT